MELPSFSEALGAVSELGGLLGGKTASVNLGGVPLTGAAVPEEIATGGEQRLAVHDLPGGARVIDALGAVEADITLSGYFEGNGATAAARRIDALRREGRKVRLAWGDEVRDVVVKDFSATYTRRGFWIPYKITLAVVPSPPPGAAAGQPGLLQRLGRNITDALGVTDTIGPAMQTAQEYIGKAREVLPIVGQLVPGSSRLLAVSQALGQADAVISAGAALADGRVGSLAQAATAIGGVVGGRGGAAAAANIIGAARGAAGLAGWVQAQGFVGSAVRDAAASGAVTPPRVQ